MPATYEPIANTTLTGTAATISFTSISSSYTDLVLIIDGKMDSSGGTIYMTMNSDTGSNYNGITLGGAATNTNTKYNFYNGTQGVPLAGYNGLNASGFFIIADINNYSATQGYKTVMSHAGNPSTNAPGSIETLVGTWKSSSAITSLTIQRNSGGNFATGTTATLFQITAA